MPELFYPGGKAKQDDVEYHNAVKNGTVGENCWLGGPMIVSLMRFAPKHAAGQGLDVCAKCTVSQTIRLHCGGRPQDKSTEAKKSLDTHKSFVQIIGDTAEALKARRDQQGLAILQALGRKKKE